MQSSTNRFSDKVVQTCDIKSYVTTFDIPTNPPMKKNTVVEFTAVAQKDSSLSRGKIWGPSIQISLSITHKDVFGNKVKPKVKILNRKVVFMRASFHFNRSTNIEIGVECQSFIVFFYRGQVLHCSTLFYDLTRDSTANNFVIDIYCRCLHILYQIAFFYKI